MKNNKIWYILVALMVSLLLMSCGNISQSGKKETLELHALADGKADIYDSEEALNEWAGLIVKVERTEEVENQIKMLDDRGHYEGRTISNVKVKEVIKDVSGNNVEIGDVLPIYEQQFTYYDKARAANIVWHVNQYNMMIPRNEYILYLNYSKNDEWYYMAGGLFGKINVSADEPLIFDSAKLNYEYTQASDDDGYILEILKKLREESLKKYN